MFLSLLGAISGCNFVTSFNIKKGHTVYAVLYVSHLTKVVAAASSQGADG